MLSEEEYIQDQRVMRMFLKDQEAEISRPSKRTQKTRPKKSKPRVKNDPPPDDEGEDNGEGEDDMEGKISNFH